MILLLFAILVPSISTVTSSSDKLIFAQLLFRHGARAPAAHLTNASYIQYFPRGLGELTDRGFENSYRLGKFLGKRYVDSGFLDRNMRTKEMYWRSVKLERCLCTAGTVGAAMFEKEQKHINVAVVTEEFDENLLNYDVNTCYREIELIQDRCPTYNLPSDFKTWPEYESFVASCLNYTHPIFAKYPFRNIEAYLNEYKNGIPLPEDLAANLPEVMGIYVKVTQWITGTGIHHDPRMMRLKFGNLVNHLIENLQNAWVCYGRGEGCEKKMKKLKVYSTQDWMLMGVLDSFGVLEESVGFDAYPEYNAMIVMELWDVEGVPRVKFYYKKEEVTELEHSLIDVTQFVRNCTDDNQKGCLLEDLSSCCDNYRERKIGESCLSGRPAMHFLSTANQLKERKRTRRFAGPE